jgi:Tfp pilus assembly protein PilF
MSSLRKYIKLLFLLIPAISSFRTIVTAQGSSIKEEIKSIVTYPYSDPNPLPSTAINSMVSPFYPYFVFDGYTDKGIAKDWKVVSLENEFISVKVLPEVGGKVWGATEKSTGLDFVYLNKVLKFRAIGIRGPWTSGGIEHNFGLDLGHAPWTSSPVDYLLKENTDGSVSCIVGGMDLASRTQWRVNIRLPADKACFETYSIWYNPNPLHDAYLSWENAGFKATDDLQFFFPGNHYIGHDGSIEEWPIDNQGRDLSFYRENNFGTSKSYHVSGFYTDWFGGYWHDSDFGFGHWAPYSDAPGKKIWIWSLARDGAIWEDLLTDNDGQYIEAQSGVKFNQASHESGFNSPYDQLSIRPYYTETKSEYWFPVKSTGGIVDASHAGTLNVISLNDSLIITISPNASISDSLYLFLNGHLTSSEYIRVKPMQPYRKAIAINKDKTDDIIVKVGNNLLTYNSDNKDIIIERPVRSNSPHDYGSSEHLFRLAEDMNAMRDYEKAMKLYLECIQKEPAHTKALNKISELCYRMEKYREGAEYAKRTLEINTYDGGANFIYGVIQKKLGDLIRAEEAFSVAARTMEYRSGSCLEIAGINLQQKDYSRAVEYAVKAIDYNRFNITAYEYLSSCYRKMMNKSEAINTIRELLEIDPLNHYARFEQYLLNPTSENLKSFKSLIINELPHETYLELAIRYTNQGMDSEAIRVLEEAPEYPIVLYWLAYLNRVNEPEKSIKHLENAAKNSPFLVFPFRLETINVLNWALQESDSWKTKYYLGLIYWHIDRPEKALELFEQCEDIPDYAPFYIARGILNQSYSNNNSTSCKDFKRAHTINPSEWRAWHYLSSCQQKTGAFQEQLKNSEKSYKMFPENPVIGIDYVKALINTGNFRKSLKVLDNITILPQEGAREGHDLYELANLSQAVSLIEQKKFDEAIKYIDDSKNWPENLGAGEPYDPDNRFQDYLSSFCFRMKGKDELADNYSNQIISYSGKNWKGAGDPSNIYIATMVFDKAGKNREAAIAMEKWKNNQDSLRNWRIAAGSLSPKAQWLMAKYNDNKEESARLEKEISAIYSETRFRLLLKSNKIINSR